ncbi:MAG: hypothetical protein ACLPPF_07695 [Rhodomicrobium sp.]
MPTERDDFSPAIKEIMAKRAGQRCSNPECRAVTSGPHSNDKKAVNLGVAAHITAAATGGPRYNPHLSPEERADITNGIWLCRYCATLVDTDVVKFPEVLLIMWKRRHEEWVTAQMPGMGQLVASARAPGLLNVSAVYPHPSADRRSCILDFRVSNQGESDLMINAVEFQVLETLLVVPLGGAAYSAQYDLDVSKLKEYLSRAECQVAQILKPGEADRFAIVLTQTSGLFAGWLLATLFQTNFGAVPGPEVEVWLPVPSVLRSFSSAKQAIVSAVDAQMERRKGFPEWGPGLVEHTERQDENGLSKVMTTKGLATSQPAKSAGYETTGVVGTLIFLYYGPQPLIKAP